MRSAPRASSTTTTGRSNGAETIPTARRGDSCAREDDGEDDVDVIIRGGSIDVGGPNGSSFGAVSVKRTIRDSTVVSSAKDDAAERSRLSRRKTLAAQMQDASAAMEFERAAALRDRIKALTQV